MKITLTKIDPDTGVATILADDKPIGHFKKAKHGPGFFVHIDGKKWMTSAGARYHQERDGTYDYAYAKTTIKIVEIARGAVALIGETLLRDMDRFG